MCKVLMINGSPHENGNTKLALKEVAKALAEEGVDSVIIDLGKQAMQGCIACGWCGRMGKCTFSDHVYDRILNEMRNGIDGVVVGSPVYYGGPNGSLCALLDRVCYSLNRFMQFKPAASVVVCRRGGASAAFDRLNKYFTILNMPVVSSQYWNMVYGQTPGQAMLDEEGMQTMRTLGKNMAWMIKKLNVAQDGHPSPEAPIRTNFIR